MIARLLEWGEHSPVRGFLALAALICLLPWLAVEPQEDA